MSELVGWACIFCSLTPIGAGLLVCVAVMRAGDEHNRKRSNRWRERE
jgi:predicted MFS family arabinose efflux permease